MISTNSSFSYLDIPIDLLLVSNAFFSILFYVFVIVLLLRA